jgi:threonine/homoserine/homoserine lactone efflux protein
MFAYLARGLILGGAAAAQPGPFQAYLLGQTLKNGWRHTLPAAFAPLISDGPIIILVVFLLTQTPDWLLILLRFGGGFFLIYLAWGAYRATKTAVSARPAPDAARQSMLQAALMNALSPHPYIFWATIAGPIFLDGWQQAPGLGLSFMFGFYGTLVGGFMLFVALFATVGRLGPRANWGLGWFSAVALFGFGIYLLAQGITAVWGR